LSLLSVLAEITGIIRVGTMPAILPAMTNPISINELITETLAAESIELVIDCSVTDLSDLIADLS
jgi:hypothetical protein